MRGDQHTRRVVQLHGVTVIDVNTVGIGNAQVQRSAVAHRVSVTDQEHAARLFGHQYIHRAIPVVVHCRHAAGGATLAAAEYRLCPVAGTANVGVKIRLSGLGNTGDIH